MKTKFLFKKPLICTWILISCMSLQKAYSDTKQQNNNTFSIITGSFIYHITPYNYHNEYTQFFDNQFLSGSIRINASSRILIGTFLNSYGNRCLLAGVEKNWHDFNDKLVFEGVYAYAGEFFLDTFDHCGDKGIYLRAKKIFNIGFAPYIYHGLAYKINSILNLKIGFMLSIAAASIEWKF